MAKVPKVLRIHRNSVRPWLAVVGLATMRFSLSLFAVGSALVLAGACVRLWAKGHLTQRRGLSTSGPYAITRNPFYLGNLLLDLGICVIIGRIEVLVPYLALWLVLHYRKILSEERALELQWGESYLAYKRAVPRLLPWRVRNLPRMWSGLKSFSWASKNITRGIEIPRFLSAVSYPFLFFSWHQLCALGRGFFEHRYTLDFCVLCAFLCLQFLARAFRRPLRKRLPALPGSLSCTTGRTVLIVCFLALTFVIRFPGMEAGHVVFPAGLAALCLLLGLATLPSFQLDGVNAVTLELLVCAVAAVLAEVPWALFFPLAFYCVLAFDRCILRHAWTADARGQGPALTRLARMRTPALILLGALLAVVKELLERY